MRALINKLQLYCVNAIYKPYRLVLFVLIMETLIDYGDNDSYIGLKIKDNYKSN